MSCRSLHRHQGTTPQRHHACPSQLWSTPLPNLQLPSFPPQHLSVLPTHHTLLLNLQPNLRTRMQAVADTSPRWLIGAHPNHIRTRPPRVERILAPIRSRVFTHLRQLTLCPRIQPRSITPRAEQQRGFWAGVTEKLSSPMRGWLGPQKYGRRR